MVWVWVWVLVWVSERTREWAPKHGATSSDGVQAKPAPCDSSYSTTPWLLLPIAGRQRHVPEVGEEAPPTP